MEQTEWYTHRVQYYETDQMGIVHHSNYIRWFEEARVDWMRRHGIGYREMEECGIITPVLKVMAEYRSMVHFEDLVEIGVFIKKYNGVVLELGYEVRDKETKQLRTVGESRHCFLNRDGKPLSLKKASPETHAVFSVAAPPARSQTVQ